METFQAKHVHTLESCLMVIGLVRCRRFQSKEPSSWMKMHSLTRVSMRWAMSTFHTSLLTDQWCIQSGTGMQTWKSQLYSQLFNADSNVNLAMLPRGRHLSHASMGNMHKGVIIWKPNSSSEVIAFWRSLYLKTLGFSNLIIKSLNIGFQGSKIPGHKGRVLQGPKVPWT